jgi:hypothetical protein
MKKTIFIILILSFVNTALADSPLTSTEFYKAYIDVPEIKEAANSDGKLSDIFFTFLISNKNDIDAKVGLINALKWKISGKNNSEIFIVKLLAHNKKYTLSNFYHMATADELICYAYLKAMDNYFDVKKALVFANKALQLQPKSYTINIIKQLIKSQYYMYNSNDFCSIYEIMSCVKEDKSLTKDFRNDAIILIFKYIDIYKQDCTFWNKLRSNF